MEKFLDVSIAGLLLGGLYALIAMGMSLQYGVARVFNIAHGEFIMLGAMTTWTLYTVFNINPLICIAICGPIAFVIGFFLHRVFFRQLQTSVPVMGAITIMGTILFWTIYKILNDYEYININQFIALAICVVLAFIVDFVLYNTLLKGSHGSPAPQAVFEAKSILFSFGLMFIIQNIAFIAWGPEIRTYNYLTNTVSIFGAVFGLRRLVTLGFAVAIGVIFYIFLARTRIGKAIRAAGQDPMTAGLMGVNINWVLALCFGLGAAMAGVAGVLISMCYPDSANMGSEYLTVAIIVVVLGGLGSIPGSFIGGFVLGIIGSVVAFYDPGLTMVAYYAIFILLLIVRPKGIMGV